MTRPVELPTFTRTPQGNPAMFCLMRHAGLCQGSGAWLVRFGSSPTGDVIDGDEVAVASGSLDAVRAALWLLHPAAVKLYTTDLGSEVWA